MKWFYLAFLPIILLLIPTCTGRDSTCSRRNGKSGVISFGATIYSFDTQCWTIEVPQGSYARIVFEELSLPNGYGCGLTHVKIIVAETEYTYCKEDTDNWEPVTASSDVIIKFSFYGQNKYYSASFRLQYEIEKLTCAQEDHFPCSHNSCIHQSKVCNGVKDCENGIDEFGCEKGVLTVEGVDITRENTITWLKNQRSVSIGWDKNTQRAITALYLAQEFSFLGQELEEELIVKQLELQASVALMRNSTDPLSVSELSMFVNALTVTCHDTRQFYGYDLLQILGERVAVEESAGIPGAYLTLCNSDWKLSPSDIRSLLKLLHKQSNYPFLLDVQALTVLALTCAKNKVEEFTSIENASEDYNATIEKFIDGQLSDGSFGNVYTTALVTQALIASGQENNKRWNVTSTMQYLMNQVNSSSIDFLSAYLTLPIFKGRSLLDIKTEHCSNTFRDQDEDNEISDVTSKLTGNVHIQYSLYVGDQKDVIHTIFLRMPDNSSAYDVMSAAQVADPKYKFLHRDSYGHMYVYGIADIINDPEAGKFWLLYAGDNINGTVKHHTESPDEFILEDAEHLIMWYKTAHI